jgi:putative protein-disulfide isomerase
VASAALRDDGHPVDAAAFLARWQASTTIADTNADFAKARAMGVRSFPALLLDSGAGLYEVSPGYADVHTLDRRLRAVLAHHGGDQPTSSTSFAGAGAA